MGIKTERFCHTLPLCHSHVELFTNEPNQGRLLSKSFPFPPQIGYSSAELAVEWLMAHPEEPAAADAAAGDSSSKGEDEAIKKQLMESLGADEVPKLEVLCISRLHAASWESSSKHLSSCACKGILSTTVDRHLALAMLDIWSGLQMLLWYCTACDLCRVWHVFKHPHMQHRIVVLLMHGLQQCPCPETWPVHHRLCWMIQLRLPA